MATVAAGPRVQLVISDHYNKFRQCHKCSRPAFPQRSSLSSYKYSSSLFSASSLSLSLEKRVRKGFRRGVAITAMADSGTSTVLVTGAGGRTGTFFFSHSLLVLVVLNC